MVLHEADVVVVGGGPAGASAAIALGAAGHHVVVLEKTHFPRRRIGESLPPKISRLFRILGIEEAVESAGFVRMAGTTTFQGDRIATHAFDPERAELGYQVDRARFDAILLERARHLGAVVLEATAATELRFDADRRVIGARAGSADLTVSSRFVIDASGVKGTVARMLGLRRREAIRTVALCGYWKDAGECPDFPAANTLFEMLPGGWLWSVLLAEGLRNVTIGVDAETLRRSGAPALEVYLGAVRASRLVSPLLDAASLVSDLTTHDATWFSSERYSGAGFLLCGDAASFIDPLTSRGVYKAMSSGILAASVINTAIRRPEDEEMALSHYEEREARTYEAYVDIALTFYAAAPFSSSPFWRARTDRVLGGPRERPAAEVSSSASRRREFIAQVQGPRGHAIGVRAKADLQIEDRTVAEAGFIVKRPALVSAGSRTLAITSDQCGVDVTLFLPLLDGRSLSAIFEGYVHASGAQRSSEQGRRLLHLLGVLAERDLIAIDRR